MKRCVILFNLIPFLAFPQKIENLKAAAIGEDIIITYELPATEAGDSYNIVLYSSHNNFTAPLKQVSGDVGPRITPGPKKIIWKAKSEVGKFKGQISFEVSAELVSVFRLKTHPVIVRRAKNVLFAWRGGDRKQPVKIELLKNGVPAGIVATTENDGSYLWKPDRKLKPGNNFQLKFTIGNETNTSNNFKLRRKIPMLIKTAAPFIAFGVYWILTPHINGTTGNLPGPPDLGLN